MLKAFPKTLLEVYESLPEGTLAELVNNQLLMEPAPDFYHQDIVTEIATQLRNTAKAKALGKVIVSPVDVYFGKENVFQPDIIFIATERLALLVKNGRVHGAPDLVIEVLSPGTEKKDKQQKKPVYEKYGVKEYWLVEPASKKVIGYKLSDKHYIEVPSQPGVIASQLLGVIIHF